MECRDINFKQSNIEILRSERSQAILQTKAVLQDFNYNIKLLKIFLGTYDIQNMSTNIEQESLEQLSKHDMYLNLNALYNAAIRDQTYLMPRLDMFGRYIGLHDILIWIFESIGDYNVAEMIDTYKYDEISLKQDISEILRKNTGYGNINVTQLLDWAVDHSETNYYHSIKAPSVELWRVIYTIGNFYANSFYDDNVGRIPNGFIDIGYY